MFRGTRYLLYVLVFTASFSPAALARRRDTGFLNRVVKMDGVEYRYQVYVPPQWTKRQKWPVILFLHGAGERGEDGLIQTEVGIATAIRRHADRFPSIVVLPQCREGIWWVNPKMQAMALRTLGEAMKEFAGDPARVYLTGLSMGGYGTWALGAKYPGRFAALVPICGGVRLPPQYRHLAGAAAEEDSSDPYAETAHAIGKTPVWAFHGAADPIVPASESQKLVGALKGAGGNVRYTEYEGVGHDSWTKAYDDPELLTWLFAQRLERAR